MRGRQSTYRAEYAKQAKALGPIGVTDAARFFAVNRSAISNWLRNEPEFRQSLQVVRKKPGPSEEPPMDANTRIPPAVLKVLFSCPWRPSSDQRAA